jgi:hypothetical protein
MPDEHTLALRKSIRPDPISYAIGDDLEFIKEQLARVPTRREWARLTLLATLTTAALVLVGIEALFR